MYKYAFDDLGMRQVIIESSKSSKGGKKELAEGLQIESSFPLQSGVCVCVRVQWSNKTLRG